MEWYERRPTDYKEDTWHLTLAEHGAYNLLLDHYYSNEAPLPDNDRALSSICNCPLEEWLAVKPAVIKFFKVKNGKLRKTKCDKIISESFKKRQDGAKRAANYRKRKTGVTRDERVSNASTGQDRTGHNNKKEYSPPKAGMNGRFEEFWELVPRKIGKKKAKALCEGITRRGEATEDELINGMRAFSDSMTGKEVQFICHPVTWLNQGRWTDVVEKSAFEKAKEDLKAGLI